MTDNNAPSTKQRNDTHPSYEQTQDRGSVQMNRRTLLGTLLAAGGGAAGWIYVNSGTDESSTDDQNDAEKIEISPPNNEIVDQYQSAIQTVQNTRVGPNQQPEFADERVVATPEAETMTANRMISRAEARPAEPGRGDIIMLQSERDNVNATTTLGTLTQAVIGVGETAQFNATVDDAELTFNGGRVPGVESYAVVAADTSGMQVILIRGESVEKLKIIADELARNRAE